MTDDRETPEQERQRRAQAAYDFLHPPAGTVLHADPPQDEKPRPKATAEERERRAAEARAELGLDKPPTRGSSDRWRLGAGDDKDK